MKHIIQTILVSLALSACISDNDSPANAFLNDFLNEKSLDDKKAVYSSSKGEYLASILDSYLERDTIWGYGKRFIILTSEEKSTILKNLRFLSPDELGEFRENYTVVSQDTLDAIFSDPEKEWSYFYQKYNGPIYRFSKPIFLRNGTLCVFYYGYSCGELCAEGNFAIYEKTWLGWKYFNSIYSWMS